MMLLHPIIHERRRPALPPKVPEPLRQLITECWRHEPTQRPAMSQVCGRLEDIASLPEFRESLIPTLWDFSPSFLKSDGWEIHAGAIPFSSFLVKDRDTIRASGEFDVIRRAVSQLHGQDWEITRAYAIKNDLLFERFTAEARVTQTRIDENPSLFRRAHWREEDQRDYRELVLNRLVEIQTQVEVMATNTVAPMLAVHGLRSEDVGWSICRSGFAAIGLLDSGYYGRGLYLTTHLPYAANVYSSRNLDDEYPLLISWALPGNTFPVVEHPTGPSSLAGKPCVSGYQSHYAVVRNVAGTSQWVPCGPTEFDADDVADELVCFSESQVLPRYLIFVRAPAAAPYAAPPVTATPDGRIIQPLPVRCTPTCPDRARVGAGESDQFKK